MLEFIENVLAELNAPAIDRKSHEGCFRTAVEEQPGANSGPVADDNLLLKPQIGNVGKITDKHVPITRKPEWSPVVFDIVVDVDAEFIEGLAIEAVEIIKVYALECRHVFLLVDESSNPAIRYAGEIMAEILNKRCRGRSTGNEITTAIMELVKAVLRDGQFEHLPLRKAKKDAPKDSPEQAMGNGDRRVLDIGNP